MKILWCVTGAGQFLSESIEAMNILVQGNQVTLVLSRAGYEVCNMYGILGELEEKYSDVVLEENQGASSPIVGRLSQREYEKVVVAPCTANTSAKIVCGIADSIVSNIVAQAGKCKVPVYILPTDALKRQETRIPVTIDHDKCKRCTACNALRVCPNDAIYVTEAVHIDLMKCDACLKCVSSCNNKAIEFGKEIEIECRDLDVANAKKMESIKGITVITSPAQLNMILVKTK
jgi:dihydromethanopterin reductase (acceptor)